MAGTDSITTPLMQCEEVLRRIFSDLAMVIDREIRIEALGVERATRRPSAGPSVHISFKMGFDVGNRTLHGCLLVPLPDAVSLAGHLTLCSDDVIAKKRAATGVDETTKEALLEVGHFVSGAAHAALCGLGATDIQVRGESCQGVRPHVRPAFPYVEGSELSIARARVKLHTWESFDAILMMPSL